MYTELIQRCKQMYLTESDGDDDSFYQLPSFLDSIASVLVHLDKVRDLQEADKPPHHPIIGPMSPSGGSLSCSVASLVWKATTRTSSPFSRFLRFTHRCWSACWWCRLTTSLSTASACKLPAAGLS